jgi:hypothetical protein
MRRRVFYTLDDGDQSDAFVFEVDDKDYRLVTGNLTKKNVDLETALEKAVAMLSANVRLNDADIDNDVLAAQMAATATIWFLFNEAADADDRIKGDVVLVEKDGDIFVTDIAADGNGSDDAGDDDLGPDEDDDEL